MTKGWIVGAVAGLQLLAWGCASRPAPARVAAISRVPPDGAFDLSGEWTSGSGPEPAKIPVAVARVCGRSADVWRFQVAVPQVSIQHLRSEKLTGDPHDLPIEETLWGRLEGTTLDLRTSTTPRTAPALYTLAYDSMAHRFRGKRQDVPAWFAPARVEQPRGCRDPLTVPSRFDLSGEWSLGGGWIESPSPVAITQYPCLYHPSAWILQQRGDTLEATTIAESHEKGTAMVGPFVRPPTISGKVAGFDVTLDDAVSHYRLRYHPESGHLYGTLNDKRVYAVRQVIARPGVCLPPP